MALQVPQQGASRSGSMYIEELDAYPVDRQSRIVSQPAALLDQCEFSPQGSRINFLEDRISNLN